MKYQTIERNNKTFYFFPDVSIDDQTRGFLLDPDDPMLPKLHEIWDDFVRHCEIDEQCFSVYVNIAITNDVLLRHLFTSYLSLPASQSIVVGRAIPKHSVIVRKKRVSAI